MLCQGIITFDVISRRQYTRPVIRGFKDDDTAKVFHGHPVRRLVYIQGIARRKLVVLDAADSLQDLGAVPGNRLKKLRGDREGQWSIRINDQWRICFVWREHDAQEVEIVKHYD